MTAISVIVPCYNAEKYISRCIDSILNQTIGIENLELILVNDASDDSTLEILQKYEQVYPDNIMVINCEENGKPGTARNIGMMYATSGYVTFVDADDYIEPDMLQYMYQCAVQYDCDLVECGFDVFRDKPTHENDIKGVELFDIDNLELRKQMLIYTCRRVNVWGKLYKRSFIIENSLVFPEKNLYEDVFFSQMTGLYVRRYCRTATVFYHNFYNDKGIIHNSELMNLLIMRAEIQESFVRELKLRGLADDALVPYHGEVEYAAIYNMLIEPYNACAASGKCLLETPMYELVNRIKKLFPDFIYNAYILKSEDECVALVTVLEGLEQTKEAARDYETEDRQKYLNDRDEYIRQSCGDEEFVYDEANELRCLSDYRAEAGNIDARYFFQDIYVANRVMKSGVKHIYDIGSRVEGYISHLLSMEIKVTMIDIRPLPERIDNLDFIQGNAMDLRNLESESVPVLSCLHALEHFGLGRYGDTVDYYGWKKALLGYTRILKSGGMLYLSVPVGKQQKVMFNAHRIFRPSTIVRELACEMSIQEFTYFHNGVKTTIDFSHDNNTERVIGILDSVADDYLGEYDCGIFILRKGE